jgi:hypothetical protein
MTWPEAVVVATSIVAVGLVISVAVWQIFRTGQTAIRKETGDMRDDVESLRAEVDELRSRLEPSTSTG